MQGAQRRDFGIKAQGEIVSDEADVAGIVAVVEADGAIRVDASFSFEEEHVVEIAAGIDGTQAFAAFCPFVMRRYAIEDAVRTTMVCSLEPSLQDVVEVFDARDVTIVALGTARARFCKRRLSGSCMRIARQ